MTPGELVGALDSPSGWQRDVAQQLLVERHANHAAGALAELVRLDEALRDHHHVSADAGALEGAANQVAVGRLHGKEW